MCCASVHVLRVRSHSLPSSASAYLTAVTSCCEEERERAVGEENVWKLCQDVSIRHSSELQRCHVVFVSNDRRTVPLWRQKAGREEEKLVIWDYHVVFLYSPDDRCLVYDLDSELPFPTHFHKYVTETFRTDHILKSDYFRYFRVVPAPAFLQQFASDRRHMKRPDGTWIKTPPDYPPITTAVFLRIPNLC